MNVNSILPIVQGMEYGLEYSAARRLENSVRAGENNYLTATCQMWQGSKTIAYASQVLKAEGAPLFSWAQKAVIYLTPIVLALLKKASFLPETIRSGVAFVQNHLGALYQAAAIASSIALLVLGQTFFAVSSLVMLAIGFLDQTGCLPATFRQCVHKFTQPFLFVTSLVYGGLFGRIFTLLNLLSWCANQHLSRKKIAHGEFTVQENLTPQILGDFFENRLPLKINRNFIHCNPFPPVPKIDIQSLVQKFDQINWNVHISTLRQKLKTDLRFIERHRNPDLKTDQQIIEIAKRSIQCFINNIQKHQILAGEPADYEKLHNYVKIIAKHVQDQDDEIIKTDILFRLAVEGGEYCGPGKFEVAESIYAQIVGENPDIPFKDKILYCLQDERNLWMQRYYYKDCTENPVLAGIGKIIDWQDIHNYNSFLNLYGDEFGLRKAAADNDDTAIASPLIQWIIAHTGSIQKKFWDQHHYADHALILKDSIGTAKLPKPEFYAFWQNWIERQQIEEREKEALLEELAGGRLYGRPIEIEGKSTYAFILLMLLDMGIVQVEAQQ